MWVAKLSAVDAEGEVSSEHPAQEVEGGSFNFIGDRSQGEHLAERQLLVFIPVSEQAIMPDFNKPVRQHMQQESTNEFKSRDGHDLPAIAIAVVTPLE